MHQRLRRQQPVEHQHAGDQPHVQVAGRAPVRVAVPVDDLPQPQALQQRQQQGQGAQVQDQLAVQGGFGRRGLAETRGALRRQPEGADRAGRVGHRDGLLCACHDPVGPTALHRPHAPAVVPHITVRNPDLERSRKAVV